jgi:folate-dependent phosphoribosylglycinamide formyltransferase PurN
MTTPPPLEIDRPLLDRPIVLLGGQDDATRIVANHLNMVVSNLVVITEDGPSRTQMIKRRARRLGWPTAFGQALFVILVMPALRKVGQARRLEILSENGLDDSPIQLVRDVSSVNSSETIALIQDLNPSLIVVNGTRIISMDVLDSIDCPFINTHAGITPLYRGVHGGYWALAGGRAEEVGTTVHLIDPGIDTGTVLARVYFDTSPKDTIATYPYLHLAAGIPALADQVRRHTSGEALKPVEEDLHREESRLFTHPTIWAYLKTWLLQGVR